MGMTNPEASPSKQMCAIWEDTSALLRKEENPMIFKELISSFGILKDTRLSTVYFTAFFSRLRMSRLDLLKNFSITCGSCEISNSQDES